MVRHVGPTTLRATATVAGVWLAPLGHQPPGRGWPALHSQGGRRWPPGRRPSRSWDGPSLVIALEAERRCPMTSSRASADEGLCLLGAGESALVTHPGVNDRRDVGTMPGTDSKTSSLPHSTSQQAVACPPARSTRSCRSVSSSSSSSSSIRPTHRDRGDRPKGCPPPGSFTHGTGTTGGVGGDLLGNRG